MANFLGGAEKAIPALKPVSKRKGIKCFIRRWSR
jgi:hypothetical protein